MVAEQDKPVAREVSEIAMRSNGEPTKAIAVYIDSIGSGRLVLPCLLESGGFSELAATRRVNPTGEIKCIHLSLTSDRVKPGG